MSADEGDNKGSHLLYLLQKGLPIEEKPFDCLGSEVGLSGAEILQSVKTWFASGVARRFGAVFDSCSLGYSSTLCAADIPAAQLEAAVARITPHPGITHCYERKGHPNLWFTLTAPADGLLPELARIGKALGPYEILNLPALQKFKIEAVFGGGKDASSASPAAKRSHGAPSGAAMTVSQEPVAAFSEAEKQIVRSLQGTFPLVEDPFGTVARQIGRDPVEVLGVLKQWKKSGVIRRIALVVRHRELGFSANSMCVWKAEPATLADAGRTLARSPHVTHCYERPSSPAFPYNLYAMIHAKSTEEAVEIFHSLGREAGLSGGAMMWSVREFKKSSPIFFCESDVKLGEPPS